jgi:hypothetical protein
VLGLKVAVKVKEFGKLDAGLQYFTVKNADWSRPVSRSTALRAYQGVLRAKSRSRKNKK